MAMDDEGKKERRISDPSPNVQLFVGNVKEYLEKLHIEGMRYNNEMLKASIEASRREREAESKRIDARWVVDVQAVAIANERAVEQAGVLATQVATSAETLRTLVAQTATTIAQQLSSVTGQLIERIAALEKVQYENQGKSGASANLLERVDRLEESKSEISGAGKGVAMTKGNLYSAIGATVAIIGVIFLIINNLFR